MRVRGGVVHRLLHVDEHPVLVRARQLSSQRVLFGATAPDRAAAAKGIERMRFALGIDQDLRPFHERFRFDPLIGAALRSDPTVRVAGRPDPFESLAWAICAQLIEYERAGAIQRRLVARLGRRHDGLSDAPDAARVAAESPAFLESLGLSAGRSRALVLAAREVASGRADLWSAEPEQSWRRLRAIPGIGNWTLQTMALTGQGRLDQLPAADLAYLKMVGRLKTGNPRARATEEEVVETFARFGEWAGLAGAYALRAGGSGAAARLAA